MDITDASDIVRVVLSCHDLLPTPPVERVPSTRFSRCPTNCTSMAMARYRLLPVIERFPGKVAYLSGLYRLLGSMAPSTFQYSTHWVDRVKAKCTVDIPCTHLAIIFLLYPVLLHVLRHRTIAVTLLLSLEYASSQSAYRGMEYGVRAIAESSLTPARDEKLRCKRSRVAL
jgi:hypothetical protein